MNPDQIREILKQQLMENYNNRLTRQTIMGLIETITQDIVKISQESSSKTEE